MSYFSRNVGTSCGASQQKITESVTLRFDRDVIDKVKDEAKRKQI